MAEKEEMADEMGVTPGTTRGTATRGTGAIHQHVLVLQFVNVTPREACPRQKERGRGAERRTAKVCLALLGRG